MERVRERRKELGISRKNQYMGRRKKVREREKEGRRGGERERDETEVTARAEVPIAGWIYI